MKTFYKIVLIAAFMLNTLSLYAQEKKSQYPEAIEDNSYFLEEAYNQEAGVVQHISNVTYFSSPQKNVTYTFTQEWPFMSQTHQLSVTIPYNWFNANTVNGFGDVLLNYRYQLTGHDDVITLSPRFSLILPTGDDVKGLGMGVTGYQFNIPASKRLSNDFITHVNAGLTIFPSVEGTTSNATTVTKTLSMYNVGASLIYLADEKYNFMLEGVFNSVSEIDSQGETARSSEFILSPGFRYAIDVGSLQIVPGVAVPFSFTDTENRTGIFFYLSFEHPFMDVD